MEGTSTWRWAQWTRPHRRREWQQQSPGRRLRSWQAWKSNGNNKNVIDRNVSQTLRRHVLICSCQQKGSTQENCSRLRMLRQLQTAKKTFWEQWLQMVFGREDRGQTTTDLVKHARPRWTPAPDREVGSHVAHNLHCICMWDPNSSFRVLSRTTGTRPRMICPEGSCRWPIFKRGLTHVTPYVLFSTGCPGAYLERVELAETRQDGKRLTLRKWKWHWS